MAKAYRKHHAESFEKSYILKEMNRCAANYDNIGKHLYSCDLVNSDGTHITLYTPKNIDHQQIAQFERCIQAKRDVVSLSVTIIPDQWFDEVKRPEPKTNEQIIFDGNPSEMILRAKELPPSESIAFQKQCLEAYEGSLIAPYLAVEFAQKVPSDKMDRGLVGLIDVIVEKQGTLELQAIWASIRSFSVVDDLLSTSPGQDDCANNNHSPSN